MSATDEKVKGRDIVLVLGGILLMADAFGLDLAMPLDLAIGVPYALVVLLGLWWPRRDYIYTAALAGSGLCLLGFYLSFAGGELGPALINRSFALFTIWMVAVLCLFQKQAQNKKLELQKLINHIGQVVSGEIAPRDESYLFKNILEALLSVTESQYGVIGEVLENEEGRPYFNKKAGMAMDFFRDAPAGLPREEPSPEIELYNTEPLFDEVILSGKPLIVKDVSPAVSKTPLPAGHRPMESFMGLPFYHEGRMLGVVGLANRVGGYDRFWVETLKPLLAASAGNIHLFRVGREQREAEDALRENSEKLQELEKDAGLLQSAMDEKDARLADDEEEVNRVKESLQQVQEELAETAEALRDKEEQVVRAEGDRDRTAEALWEKEERLMQVVDDFNQLEQDLKGENETVTRIEEDLKQVQDKLRGKDLRIEEMENRLGETQSRLREKERQVAQAEEDRSQIEKASIEKDRRYQQMDLARNDLERNLKEYETRLSEVEGNLAFTKKTLRDREEHLERIGREIQSVLSRKEEGFFSKEAEGMQPRGRVFEKAENPPAPKKNNGRLKNEFENGEKLTNGREHPVSEVEHSNQDLQEFAAIASHDLQEPLRKIIGFGSRLQKDCAPALDDRGKDYLNRMDRAAHKMQKFIGDLLQYSKVTAQTLPRQRVDLKKVIASVLVNLELRVEESQARIEIDALPVIEGDPVQMHQLFQNLLSNALKFHESGEPPIVSVRHRLLENGLHEIRVEDRGIGFDEKYLQRIFKPFERLHGNMEYEGTGMGLAICQKIVRRHGGEITAISSLRKGTTFIFTLPERPTA